MDSMNTCALFKTALGFIFPLVSNSDLHTYICNNGFCPRSLIVPITFLASSGQRDASLESCFPRGTLSTNENHGWTVQRGTLTDWCLSSFLAPPQWLPAQKCKMHNNKQTKNIRNKHYGDHQWCRISIRLLLTLMLLTMAAALLSAASGFPIR